MVLANIFMYGLLSTVVVTVFLIPIVLLTCIIGTIYYLVDRSIGDQDSVGLLTLGTTVPSLTFFLYYTTDLFSVCLFQTEIKFIWSVFIGISIFLIGICIAIVALIRTDICSTFGSDTLRDFFCGHSSSPDFPSRGDRLRLLNQSKSILGFCLMMLGGAICFIGITLEINRKDHLKIRDLFVLTPYMYQNLIFRSFLTAALTVMTELIAVYLLSKISSRDQEEI